MPFLVGKEDANLIGIYMVFAIPHKLYYTSVSDTGMPYLHITLLEYACIYLYAQIIAVM